MSVRSVAQLCPTLFDIVDCSPPGSSVRGILQARILEWFASSSSRGSSRPRDHTCVYSVSCTADGFFTSEPPEKPFAEVVRPPDAGCVGAALSLGCQALGFESQLCSMMAGEETDAFSIFVFFFPEANYSRRGGCQDHKVCPSPAPSCTPDQPECN